MAAIIMATLKCLACEHDNKVGDESCLSCSSSLNLKLCSACEAINANRAERCHSCGTAFIAPEPAAVPVLEDAVAFVELAPSKWLPARVRLVEAALPRRGRARAVVLWTPPLIIVLAVLAYLNGQPGVNAQPGALAEAPAAAAPVPPAASQGSPAPPPRASAPQPRASTPQPRASTEAKHPAATTHTNPAPGLKVAPEVKTAPAALAAPVAPAYGRVTHTRPPEPGSAPAVAPAAEAPPAMQPQVSGLKDSSHGCAPAVAALGLCSTK